MLYFDAKTRKRLTEKQLKKRNLTPDSEGIYPLATHPPPHDNRWFAALPTPMVVGDPETGFSVAYQITALPFSVAKERLLKRTTERKEAILKSIEDGYTESEVKTWPQQQQEADLVEAGMETGVEIIDTICQHRGLTREQLATKIKSKVLIAKEITGNALGVAQRIEDALESVDPNGSWLPQLKEIENIWFEAFPVVEE